MASFLTNLLKSTLFSTVLNYFLKGGLIAGASNLFLGQIRKKVKTSFQFAIGQVIFFGIILFLIDYILPRFLGKTNQLEKRLI